MDSSSVPLAVQLEWYKIRDMLFGQNWVSQDIPQAVRLAATCSHPDARLLHEACAGREVATALEAKDLFLALSDVRAQCWAWLLSETVEMATLQRLAQPGGYAFAQSTFASKSRSKDCRQAAKLAAAQGERDGFFWLGSTSDDASEGMKWMKKAVELVRGKNVMNFQKSAISTSLPSLCRVTLMRWNVLVSSYLSLIRTAGGCF